MLQTSLPSIQMWPAFGLSKPTRCLRNPDLPVPEGPSSTEISPAGNVRETSSQIVCLPNRLVRFSTRTSTPTQFSSPVTPWQHPHGAGVLLFSTGSQLMSNDGGRPNLLCGHRLL